jgi:hypothetical protein
MRVQAAVGARLCGVTAAPSVLVDFGGRLAELGWVTDLWIAGSLATGDYVPGVSDLDLVAIVDGPVDDVREAALVRLHGKLDRGVAAGADLGCVYVDDRAVVDSSVLHPTWTHGVLVHRILSGITRAELVRHGSAQFGRPPAAVLPSMSDDDVREAARAEVCGYWAWASRRPWVWLDPVIAELGLTGMARGRHALQNARLLTKTEAIDQACAPEWFDQPAPCSSTRRTHAVTTCAHSLDRVARRPQDCQGDLPRSGAPPLTATIGRTARPAAAIR